jgi:WD40 repeat protein
LTLRLLLLANGAKRETAHDNIAEIFASFGIPSSVASVAFAPDDRTPASGSDDNTVRLWDVASGKELRRFEGHDDAVRSVAFAPDGRTLASGTSDNTICLLRDNLGEKLLTLIAAAQFCAACRGSAVERTGRRIWA